MPSVMKRPSCSPVWCIQEDSEGMASNKEQELGDRKKRKEGRSNTDLRIYSGRCQGLEKSVKLNEKMTELLPSLVNKGGGISALWTVEKG